MKVYIVLLGYAYEGEDIKAVFLNKEEAYTYASKNFTDTRYGIVDVQEWEVIQSSWKQE